MTVVGREQLDHPALSTPGGSGLHTSIETIYTNIGDDNPGRFKVYAGISNATLTTVTHNFGVQFADLKVYIYTGSHPTLTRVADPVAAGWTIVATGGTSKTQINVTTPGSGGPHTFAVWIVHGRGTEKTTDLDDVSTTPPTNGQILIYDNGTGKYIPTTTAAALTSSTDKQNLTLTTSVASSALTIALKDAAGSNPSAGSPVNIAFRSSTLTSGLYNVRSVTSALSIIIPNGSGLGHSSGADCPVYVYALDNAGTVELAVSMNLFDDGTVQSTTGGGSGSTIVGSAASQGVLYSVTARSNVPIRLIGKLISNQSAQGTWNNQPQTDESYVPDRSAVVIQGNQAAAAVPIGYIGEYLSATRTLTNAISLSTGTDSTVCSFNVSGGIWLISGACGFQITGTTTISYTEAAIINGGTSTAGFADQAANVNYSTPGTILMNLIYNGGTQGNTLPIVSFPALYVRLTAATTTFNLVAQSAFGVSTCKAFGSMNAIRIA